MTEEAPEPRKYLEFYRLDLSDTTRSVLIPAAILIAVGSIGVCIAGARIPIGMPRDMIGFAGGATVLFGLVLGFGTMGRLLSREGFVGVTRDGIHVKVDGSDEFVPWDDIETVRETSPGGLMELVKKGTSAGVVALPKVSAPTGVVIHDRLNDLRRKASLGLLPAAQPIAR